MIEARAKVLFLSLVAALALLGALLPARASQPFSPSLSVSLSNGNPSANSDVATVIDLPPGQHALGTWALFLPVAWSITDGLAVPDGNVVAQGTMSVDVDCDSTVETFGPFFLTDQPHDPTVIAEWSGQITSWWLLNITIDQPPTAPVDISASMTSFVGEFHTLCAPQTFALTFCGRANPNPSATVCGSGPDPVIMTDPASPGTYTWSGIFIDEGGAHSAQPSASVSIVTSSPTPAPTDADGATATAGNPTDGGGGEPWLILIGGPILAFVVAGYGAYWLVRRRRGSQG